MMWIGAMDLLTWIWLFHWDSYSLLSFGKEKNCLLEKISTPRKPKLSENTKVGSRSEPQLAEWFANERKSTPGFGPNILEKKIA